jgi:hypothetical protein
MVHWFKLSHPQHTGRLRPHEHTSYLPLGIILLLASFPLSIYTAGAVSPGPSAGSIGLSGTVPASPPKTGATIKSPASGSHFTTTPVPISGTCQPGTLIELYKNDIFAGSAPCGSDGTYKLEIDLMIGQNKVITKTYDALNQTGPDSEAVTLYYDALPAQSSATTSLYFGGPQLILNTDAVFRGSFPGQSFNVPIDILGGTAPYAINVQWGDNANQVVSRPSNVTFSVAHAYAKAGTYQMSIQATDAAGRVAFLTVASIINGQPAPVTAASVASSGNEAVNILLLLWPLYAGALATVISFWLGERREVHVLRKHGLLLQS